MVDATTGVTRIFLRPGADPLAEAWANVASGVVEPVSALPESVLRATPYPVELFRVQTRQVEQGAWKPGALAGRPAIDASAAPREGVGWAADTSGPLFLAAYERASERRLSAVLVARREEGQDALTLMRLDSTDALPSRSALESRWSRFASFDALSDSIREDGGSLEQGPVRLGLGPAGVIGYKAYYAQRGPGRLAVAWVSLAAGAERMGAGRSLAEGWNNLLGASVPTMPGSAQSTRWRKRAAGSSGPIPRFATPTGPTSDSAWRGPAPVPRIACGYHGFVSLLASGPGLACSAPKTAVLALGGNALARAGEPATIANQFRHARESIGPIVELAREGWRIAIVHGNGPQVGDELVRNESARRTVEPLPLGVLVAGTAGWIGYMLQQSLQNALAAARVERQVVTVVTQTLVDRYDPALNAADQADRPRADGTRGGTAARSRSGRRPRRRRRMAPDGDEPDAPRHRGASAGATAVWTRAPS